MPNFRNAFPFRWCLLVGAFAALATANAAPPNIAEHHTRLPTLSIPFSPNVAGSRVKDVELYSSTDQGRTWVYVTQQQLSPRREDNKFRHTIQNDGSYWFAVRSIDQAGAAHPPSLDQMQAGLVVHLDRRPPLVQLRAATPTRPNVVGVEWDVREEHFDPSRFSLEYRVPGQSDWVAQQPTEVRATGTQYWELTAAPRIEVRMKVGDRAGNESEQVTLMLSPGGGGGSAASSGGGFDSGNQSPNAGSTSSNPSSKTGTHFINSLQIGLPFTISNVGVSGVPVADLWATKDLGRTWQKVPRPTDDPQSTLPQTPGDGQSIQRTFTYNAPGEGVYGFAVVVRSGVGIGDADPRPGDAPKRLIEVDITKPAVELRVTNGSGPDVRNVIIEWTARDKNLAERPVTLMWSKSKDGPDWETIVPDQDARGRYVWNISDQGPFQFYVQVRATDKAGNVGSATGNDLITVDLNRPKADLLDPVPIKKN